MRATYIHSQNVIAVEFPDNAQGENFQIPCSSSFWEAAHPQTGKWSVPQIKRAVAAAVVNQFDWSSDDVHFSSWLVENVNRFEYYVQDHMAAMRSIRVRLMETNEFHKPVRAEKKVRAAWRRRFVLID